MDSVLQPLSQETAAPEGMLRWKFDFADVQSVDEVLDKALLEDMALRTVGVDTDDDVGRAKMADAKDGAELSMFHRRRRRPPGPRWRW